MQTTADREPPDFRSTKHKVRIYDKDVEVDYDELRRGYQLKQASHKALEEASHAKRQASDLLSKIQSKDRKVFSELLGGEDKLRQWAEDLLIDDLEQRSLPEPERRARAAEARAKELEAWKKSETERQQGERRQRIEYQAAQSIETDITEAFTAHGAKPTPYLVARVADEMAAALEHGRQLTAAQALDRVARASTSEIQEMAPDRLMERLTPAQVEYIRKHLVDQVMGQQPRRVRAPATASRSGEPKREMTIDEAINAKIQSYKRG